MLLGLGEPFQFSGLIPANQDLFSCLVGASAGQELYHLLTPVPAQVGCKTLQQGAIGWWSPQDGGLGKLQATTAVPLISFSRSCSP